MSEAQNCICFYCGSNSNEMCNKIKFNNMIALKREPENFPCKLFIKMVCSRKNKLAVLITICLQDPLMGRIMLKEKYRC